MLIDRNDFSLKARNFDLTQPWNILRIIAGAFFLPHAAGKFVDGGINPGTVGFFTKAGLTPGEVWVALAACGEVAVGVALILGLCTRFAALGGAAILAFAVYALQTVGGFKGWTWNTGGYEYPVFWAIVCLTVSMEAFRARRTGR